MSEPWNGYIPGLDPSNIYVFGPGTTLPGLAEDQRFEYDEMVMNHGWCAHGAMPYSPVTQRQYLAAQLAGAANGQQITPYSSHPPSVWTDHRPPSVNTDQTDPNSAGGLDAQPPLYNHGEQVVVDQYPQGDLNFIDPRHTDDTFIPLELLEEDLKAPRDENAQDVVAPTPNPVPPEQASQRMPTQRSMDTARQEVDDAVANLEAAARRLLAQNPNYQSLSPISQRLDGIRCAFAEYAVVSRRREMPPPGSPSVKGVGDKIPPLKGQLYYRCPMTKCNLHGDKRAVMRRHVDTMHYPQWEYYCHHKDLGCSVAVKPIYRRDKLIEHYKNHRELSNDKLKAIIDEHRVELPCPPVCFCGLSVNSWEEFYECFLKHCECEPPSDHEHRRKRPRDDRDDDPFDHNPGNGGPALSKQGKGRSGNANGRGQHRSFSGATGNQLSSGESKPLLRARSASDSYGERTKGSWAHHESDAPPPTFESKPSGSGKDQSAQSKKNSTRPPLDLRTLQGEAGSPSSMNRCKTCQHVFNTCSTCCDSPPSTDRCHMCPPMERTTAVQAGYPHVDLALRQSLLVGQNMGLADHLQFNQHGIHAGSDLPMTVNPALLIAREQSHWQTNQNRQQRAPAQGPIPRTSNQQRSFGGNQRYVAGAVHGIQVRGMSELDMEFSIMESKSKRDSKNTQSSSTWSVILPFRSSSPHLQGSKLHLPGPQLPRSESPLPLCKPLTGTGSISIGGMEIITREFIGPPAVKDPSSGCQCPCRTRSQAMYFTRGRLDIAPGRKIELDFTMAQEAHDKGARGMSHLLRTRIQVVVKILRLRTAAKSASDKDKKEACAAFKGALEATVYGPDSTSTTDQEDAELVLDDSCYDSEAESVAESIITVCTQASTSTEVTVPFASNSPRPSFFNFSRTSSCTNLTWPSRPASPGLSGFPQQSSYPELKLPAPARSRSPLRWSWDDDTLSNEELPIQDTGLFEKEDDDEEKEMELALGSDLQSSLDRLSRWTGGMPADELCSGAGSAWDPERVSQYLMGHSLSLIFSQASRGNGFNPSLDKKPSS